MPTAVILLAAGQGTRMNSDLPKVLHPLAGVPLIAHALAAARGIEPERTILVTGHGGDAVAAAARGARRRPRASSTRPSSSAPATRCCRRRRRSPASTATSIVLYGDTPLRPPRDAAGDARRPRGRRRGVVVLGFEAADPGGYGRLVLDADGGLAAIVEARDADAATAGDPALQLGPSRRRRRDAARPARRGRQRQRQGRILPDRRRGARPRPRPRRGGRSPAPRPRRSASTRRADLAAAEAAFQARARAEAMANGATLTDPARSGSPSTPSSAATW